MRRSGSGMPTRRSHSIAFGARAAPRRRAPRSPRRSGRPRASPGSGWWRLLEDHADAPAAHRASPTRAGQHLRRRRRCAGRDVPLSGSRRISASAVIVLLPQPDSPTSAKVSPRRWQRSGRRWRAPAGIGVELDLAAFDRRHRLPAPRLTAASPVAQRMRSAPARAGRRRRARRRRTGWPPAPASP